MNAKKLSESIKAMIKEQAEIVEKQYNLPDTCAYERGALGAWVDILCERLDNTRIEMIAEIVNNTRKSVKEAA